MFFLSHFLSPENNFPKYFFTFPIIFQEPNRLELVFIKKKKHIRMKQIQ